MFTVTNPFPNSAISQSKEYISADFLNGTLRADLGVGEDDSWRPSGMLQDLAEASPDDVMIWQRHHCLHAATHLDVELEQPQAAIRWYLDEAKLGKTPDEASKRDVVFARLVEPNSHAFLQNGYEKSWDQLPGRPTEGAKAWDESQDWGGFVHVGTSRLNMRYVHDTSDVCQEALTFEVQYAGLLHFLGADAPTDPIAMLKLAAEKIVAEQFPSRAQIEGHRFSELVQTGMPQILQDEMVFGEVQENGVDDGSMDTELTDVPLKDRVAHAAGAQIFANVIGPDYTPDIIARAAVMARSSQTDMKPHQIVTVDLRSPLTAGPRAMTDPKFLAFRITIERPRLREYGMRIKLLGGVRDMVAALIAEMAEENRVQASANALTLDDIFATPVKPH